VVGKAGWQTRRHDSLRDPDFPRRALSPNEAYASLVAVAGYLPVTLTGDDYRELLPVTWRAINDYGIRIDYRTYHLPADPPIRIQPGPAGHDQRAEPAAARTQHPVVPALPPRRPRHPAPRPHPARPDPRLVTPDGRHRRHHLRQPDHAASRA
jgi:hypothetical protein